MADPILDMKVAGLDEFTASIRKASKDLGTEQRKKHRVVSTKAVGWVKSAASGGTPLERLGAADIAPSATVAAARLLIRNGPGRPAFWGAKGHSGWYDQPKFAGSTPQFPTWVGNTWIAGKRGEGPYVINDVLADRVEEIEALYAEAYEAAVKSAFPGGFE